MGSQPSKGLDVIPTNTRVWEKKSSDFQRVTGEKTQQEVYGKWKTSCTNCSGDSCSSGNCSAFTSWAACSGSTGQVVDANGEIYTPSGGGDAQFGTENCYCSSPTICSRANIEECWLGFDSNNQEPTFRADWNGSKRLKCTFDLSKIDNISQIGKYVEKFNPDPNDKSYFEIMKKFCTSQSKKCGMDPVTRTPISTCSLIKSTEGTESVDKCRLWFEGLNSANRDAFIGGYCGDEKTRSNVECQCENRIYSDDYKEFENVSTNFGSDACTWVPCKNTNIYFVKDELRKQTCPVNVCQNVYDIQKIGGNVSFNGNTNNLVCTFPGTIAGGKVSESVPNPIHLIDFAKLEAPKSQSATNRKQIGYIILFFLVGLIIYLVSRNFVK